MRFVSRVAGLLLLLAIVACSEFGPAASGWPDAAACCPGGISLRVFNAYPAPVYVLVDGRLAVGPLAPGGRMAAAQRPGTHTVTFHASDGSGTFSRTVTIREGAMSTVVAVGDAEGSVSGIVLDDTSTVVPAGTTKVRVLHLAARAGPLQVYRTQPDMPMPVVWQTPFEYQPEPTSASAPYYQSTVGTWEIRAWQTPDDASGWANAPLRVELRLASGEKRTVVIFDGWFGALRIEVL